MAGVHSQSNLPNYTHVKLGVVVDEKWVRSGGESPEHLIEIILSTISEADSNKFAHGEIQVEWTNDILISNDYGEGMRY